MSLLNLQPLNERALLRASTPRTYHLGLELGVSVELPPITYSDQALLIELSPTGI